MDWSALIKKADNSISDLSRSISAVDRYNPIYFRIFASIALVLSGTAIALALTPDLSSPILIGKFLLLLLMSAIGLAAAVLSWREAVIHDRRSRRARSGLARILRDAELLAGLGLVSTDKLDPESNDDVKVRLMMLRDTIRDAHERLDRKG